MNNLTPEAAGEILRNGGVVVIPTETVYGLAARADRSDAVARIFEAKGRPADDPLIVHLADLEQLPMVAAEIPAEAWLLAGSFWPGPLTLVLPKLPIIPDAVTSGLPTVAVRIPSHPIAREVIRSCGFPLAAPSANPFGRTSPTRTAHLDPQMMERVDGVVEGGACTVGVESTIIGLFPGRPPMLLRLGGLPLEQIEEVIGPVAPLAPPAGERGGAQLAPGRLPSHYAPHTPLYLFSELPEELRDALASGAPVARLTFGNRTGEEGWNCIAELDLSYEGDLAEAARNLYKMMIELDQRNARAIVVDLLPEVGLGRAINDRLRRAAHRPS